MGMEFTNNPASARRVLLSLELDLSNMSDWQQNRPTTSGDRTTDKLLRLPSLNVLPEGISLEININPRRGGDVDCLLHPPLRGLHLQILTKEAESQKDPKHSHKKRGRRYTSSSSSSSISDNQSRDYGRYKRRRHSPQAEQNPSILQPAEITNVQTIPQPEQTL